MVSEEEFTSSSSRPESLRDYTDPDSGDAARDPLVFESSQP